MNRTHQTNVRLTPKTRISACLSLPRGAFTLWEGFFSEQRVTLVYLACFFRPISNSKFPHPTPLALANSII